MRTFLALAALLLAWSFAPAAAFATHPCPTDAGPCGCCHGTVDCPPMCFPDASRLDGFSGSDGRIGDATNSFDVFRDAAPGDTPVGADRATDSAPREDAGSDAGTANDVGTTGDSSGGDDASAGGDSAVGRVRGGACACRVGMRHTRSRTWLVTAVALALCVRRRRRLE